MAGNIELLCNKIIGRTVVGCEVDFERQVIYLDLDDDSLVEISGDNLDVYTEFTDLDD